MTKELRLGSDPLNKLSWIKDSRKERKPVNQHASKLVRQHTVKPVIKSKKATYYIDPNRIKQLKMLGVQLERDASSLVNEAIADLLKKNKQ